MRHTILFAGMVVLAILMTACSDGGTTPTTPAPHQLTVEYRLYVLDLPDGGQKITELSIRQGANTPFEVRYDSREGTVNWYPVAQESTLDVTIEGAQSGHKVPDIGLSGGQYRLRSGTCRLEFFPPCGGQLGTAWLVLRVRESGASVRISLTILPQSDGGNPPPSPPSCRDLHSTKEAIDGFWWDCVDGVWENTGESVNPPPPPVSYTLHIYGAQGEFTEGGTINVDEGNGYQLQVWELQGSDGSKISLDGSVATMESDILPFWCWDPDGGEINTALWATPSCPDPTEPGNIFINPGGPYDMKFSVSYGSKAYSRSGTLKVLDRPDFP